MRIIYRVIETSWFKGLLITQAYDSCFKILYILLTLTVIRNHTIWKTLYGKLYRYKW